MEFVTLIPLLLIMILFIAQFFVAGMAVVETEVTLRETCCYAAEIGEESKAIRWRLNPFQASGHYDIESLKVEIKDEEVIATARTRIEWLFTSASPFHYRST